MTHRQHRDPKPIEPQRAIRVYDTSDYEELKEGYQHNIMMLVGNGFDISALQMLEADYRTTYTSFFYFLKAQNFNPQNVLFSLMNDLRIKHEGAQTNNEQAYSNWSDFEVALQQLLDEQSSISQAKLREDLQQLQQAFSRYLDIVGSPDILNRLDRQAKQNGWADLTFSRFLEDLNEEQHRRIELARSFNHYHLLNVNVINFNFTFLLDNYLFLDQHQFDPHRHLHADRNFSFWPNRRDFRYNGSEGNKRTVWSSYLMTEIHHPHGVQQVPRSLLFGVDASDDVAKKGSEMKLEKPFWAQTPRRFQKMIAESELFIIFGSSLGSTDRWWWRHILAAVGRGAQVIIYQYVADLSSTSITEDTSRDTFVKENFDRALFDTESLDDQSLIAQLKENIIVVLFDDPTSLSAFGWSTSKSQPTI